MSKKVALIGTGLVGRSWAVLYSRGGYQVSLYDVSNDVLTHATSLIQSQLTSMEESGLLLGLFFIVFTLFCLLLSCL